MRSRRPPSCTGIAVTARAVPRRLRSTCGLTLLELVMVIFVVGLVLGLTLPLASSLAGRFRAGSARDVFVSYYARARAAGVQYGREGRLRIDASNGRFWVEVDTGESGALATDTIGMVSDVRRDYGGVIMFSTKQLLCFDSRGLPFTGGSCEPHDASIIFQRADHADTVQLSLGGTVLKK